MACQPVRVRAACRGESERPHSQQVESSTVAGIKVMLSMGVAISAPS